MQIFETNMQKQVLESGTSQLALRVYEPAQPARASVVIGGAMGVRRNFYAPFAGWLSGQGFRVTTFDDRGSGESSPDIAHTGLRGFKADLFFPVMALSVTADELMTWRGKQNLIKPYTGAPCSFERITPADLGASKASVTSAFFASSSAAPCGRARRRFSNACSRGPRGLASPVRLPESFKGGILEP